jgi:hypothetical protein
VLSFLSVEAKEQCPSDCYPNGQCVEGECKCDYGYAGADCSFPFEHCPDGLLTCFDGSECQRSSMRQQDGTGRTNYQCSCDNISDASPFQIAECESPESEHCERGQPTSDYAFCTNGGKCKSLIWHGEPHAGCICNPEFEGRHCQYREGTAPEEELDIAENKSHITAGYIFFIVLTVVVFGVAGILGHAYYANMKEKNQAQNDVHVDFDQSDKTGQMA